MNLSFSGCIKMSRETLSLCYVTRYCSSHPAQLQRPATLHVASLCSLQIANDKDTDQTAALMLACNTILKTYHQDN